MLFQNLKLTKAYLDINFMNSSTARPLRILSEYLNPLQVFTTEKVTDTVIFFGSARALSKRQLHHKYKKIQKEPTLEELALTKAYMDAAQLSFKLTKWLDGYFKNTHRQFYICSGGGPGIMQAANRGSFLAGGRSIGLNIELPFEQIPNRYITHSLCLDFNYFFMRKYWFMYFASAVIVFPGGFGTLDELFEFLTLIQTKKITKKVPIILYNTLFWKNLISFDLLVKWKLVKEEDIHLFIFIDTVEEAYTYLKNHIVEIGV